MSLILVELLKSLLSSLVIYLIMSLINLRIRPIVFNFKPPGANAKNFLFFILIDPKLKASNDYFPVLAQELYEVELLRPLFAGFKVYFDKEKARNMEALSHAIEVAKKESDLNLPPDAETGLEHDDVTDHRWREARVLTGYRQFKGFSKKDIYCMMWDRIGQANNWLDTEYPKIKPIFIG